MTVAKVIELPAVAGADVARMVGFELERHLPFPPAEALVDFQVLEEASGRPVRVLLVAVDRRVLERVRQLLRESGCVPRLLDVAIHTLASSGLAGGARAAVGALVHLGEAEAELAVLRHGRPILSRHFPLPPGEARIPAAAERLAGSLESLPPPDRAALAEIVAVGESAEALGPVGSAPIRIRLDLAPVLDARRLAPAHLPAAAMAARDPRRGSLRTNLLPPDLRPRPFPWAAAATGALAAAALLLALAIPVVSLVRDQRRLDALDGQVARLAVDVRRVSELAKTVEQARREVETLRGFETHGVRALPLLRELTELLPGDVWLTNVTADRKGVELAGFAGSAAQLIPILEASPTLERVEFTSPVTKGRDREQFRLKAAWEGVRSGAETRPGAAPSPPVPPAGAVGR
jgi:Tfp pilus assembly protein PilN